MLLDGFADLRAEHLGAIAPDGVTLSEAHAVGELEPPFASIDFLHHVAATVLIPPGLVVQVVPVAQDDLGLLRAALVHDVRLDPGADLPLWLHPHEAEERRVEVLHFGDARDLDALDEVAPVRLERGEPVDEIGARTVGGAVAQGEERMQRAKRLTRPLAFHVLRLVEDEDGPRLLHELEWAPLARKLL